MADLFQCRCFLYSHTRLAIAVCVTEQVSTNVRSDLLFVHRNVRLLCFDSCLYFSSIPLLTGSFGPRLMCNDGQSIYQFDYCFGYENGRCLDNTQFPEADCRKFLFFYSISL